MVAGNIFVIDSSFVLSYLLPDESIDQVQHFFNQLKIKEINLVTCDLLPFEVFNGFKIAISRNRISLDLAKQLGKTFFEIPIRFQAVDFQKVLSLANKHKLTVYDAAYLFLSQSEDIPLLTLDKKLQDLA